MPRVSILYFINFYFNVIISSTFMPIWPHFNSTHPIFLIDISGDNIYKLNIFRKNVIVNLFKQYTFFVYWSNKWWQKIFLLEVLYIKKPKLQIGTCPWCLKTSEGKLKMKMSSLCWRSSNSSVYSLFCLSNNKN